MPKNTKPFCNSGINIGDSVMALRDMWFDDGTKHNEGEVILVNSETIADFREKTDDFNYAHVSKEMYYA
jgi:hypothetical protein